MKCNRNGHRSEHQISGAEFAFYNNAQILTKELIPEHQN